MWCPIYLTFRSLFRARFKRDETRRDWTSFLELAVPGKDYFFLVPLLEKIREKNGTGRDGTTQYGSGKSRVLSNFETFPRKPL